MACFVSSANHFSVFFSISNGNHSPSFVHLNIAKDWLVVSSDFANGPQEAPLLAKPFLAHLTCSEIHAVPGLAIWGRLDFQGNWTVETQMNLAKTYPIQYQTPHEWSQRIVNPHLFVMVSRGCLVWMEEGIRLKPMVDSGYDMGEWKRGNCNCKKNCVNYWRWIQ